MGSGTALGWANFLTAIGAATPGIVKNYNEQSTAEAELAKKTKLRDWGASVLKGMPQVGSPVLDEMAQMDPATASTVLQNTPPANRQQAMEILSQGRKGLDGLRLKFPTSAPDGLGGVDGALESIATPRNPRHVKNAFVNRFMDTLSTIESGGQDIGDHPQAKNGATATGRFGVVPEFHAQRVGLDPSNPADLAKFKADPELQRAAAEDFVRELGRKYNWDPGMMRRGYYGITGNNDAPQYLADGRAMPSSNEDNAKFLAAFGNAQRPDNSDVPASLPWDNTLLSSLVAEPPKMKTVPKKVTYGDQERYLLSKVENPEQLAMMKDYLATISGLAKEERDAKKDERGEFDKNQTRYDENVRKVTDLNFQTWKEKQTARDKRFTRNAAQNKENLTALRQQRESLQKQLLDLRTFEQRAAKGKEPVELISAAYPEFYTTRSGEPGFLDQLVHGGDAVAPQETKLDRAKLKKRAEDIQAEIDGIDQELSNTSRASSIKNADPGAPPALSKYLIPRKK